jgi:hypothetical protein
MIRTLTIIENVKEDGLVEYTINGSLPLEEVARALVIIAFNAPKPAEKEE